MAAYTWFEETVTRRVWQVDLPCQIGDVRAMLSSLTAELDVTGLDPSWDDCAQVESDGETLRLVVSAPPQIGPRREP